MLGQHKKLTKNQAWTLGDGNDLYRRGPRFRVTSRGCHGNSLFEGEWIERGSHLSLNDIEASREGDSLVLTLPKLDLTLRYRPLDVEPAEIDEVFSRPLTR